MLSRAQQSLLKVDCILRDFRSNRDISLSQIIDFHFAKHISILQITDFYFANHQHISISQITDYHFVSSRFANHSKSIKKITAGGSCIQPCQNIFPIYFRPFPMMLEQKMKRENAIEYSAWKIMDIKVLKATKLTFESTTLQFSNAVRIGAV